MTDLQLLPKMPRPIRAIAMRSVVWSLVVVALWDGIGFVGGGDAVTTSPSYEVLRHLPGVRELGVVYLVLALALVWALGRQHGRRGHKCLLWALGFGMGLYMYVTLALIAAWFVTGHIAAIGAPSKTGLIVFLYFLTARARDLPEVTPIDRR